MKTLNVSGFLGIEKAQIEADGLTVLIGPQASGKSIVARLIYFCIEYFADFDELALMRNEHKKTYDARKREDFYKLFPPYSWTEDDFHVSFKNEAHELEVFSSNGSATIEIRTSKSVATAFRLQKNLYQAFVKSKSEEGAFSPTRLIREYRSGRSDAGGDIMQPHALFVPAARSFYATLREEIFSILSMDEKIDQIIMQFGEFYEGAKFQLEYEQNGRIRRQSRPRNHLEYFDAVIRGRYVKTDGRDWIHMDRGRIEISKASSGQQEALPLLCAISQFPRPGRTLIIEEPEAHLFPSSQVKVLEFIVMQTVDMKANILVTTHSPYLLSALNNYILRDQIGRSGGIPGSSVNAYSLVDGIATNIYDDDMDLISGDYIDSVSEEIFEEFSGLLESSGD